jgi:hypothetical protein
VHLHSFGYAQAALESYEVFAALKRQGVLAPDARFQVCIPPPLAALSQFVAIEDRKILEPVVERAFLADLAAIMDGIPHDQLAIQWDVAVEIALLEGLLPSHFDDPFPEIVERLVQVGDAVSEDISLSYHFCYGSPYDIHVIEPKDTGLMVRLANAVIAGLHRRLDRLHLPVPIQRDDAAYFAPLVDLRLDGAELFLGLLHHEDGVEGARRRIAAAKRFVNEFGVATECGTGRTIAEPVGLLRLHAQAAPLADQPLDISIEVPEQPRPQAAVNPEQVNAGLRAFAEQSGCPECGAVIGEPCRNKDDSIPSRPHMDRYNDALLAHVGQET